MSGQLLPMQNDQGQFIQGHPSPWRAGRPPRGVHLGYVQILRRQVPLEKFKRIVDVVAKAAEGGDLKAAAILFRAFIPQKWMDYLPREEAEKGRVLEYTQGLIERLKGEYQGLKDTPGQEYNPARDSGLRDDRIRTPDQDRGMAALAETPEKHNPWDQPAHREGGA